MERSDLRQAELLNRFWDELALGRRPDASLSLDRDVAALVEQLDTLGEPPDADSARERVWREVRQHRRWTASAGDANPLHLLGAPTVGTAPNGKAPWIRPHPAVSPMPPARRATVHVATALLVLVVLVGSLFVIGFRRSGGPADAPSYLPAVGEKPMPLEGQESTPIAEFLWEADGGPDALLRMPSGAGVDPDGNLWVTDGTGGRFVIFSPDGAVLETWGTRGEGEGEFDFSCGEGYGGVAFDAAGNIYVADAGNGRIQKFGPDRDFLASWPIQGIVDSELLVTGRGNRSGAGGQPSCPAGIAVDREGRVVVSDRLAGEVKVFDSDGRPLVTAATENAMMPEGVAVDGAGNIWVADNNGRVLAFAPDGSLLAEWQPRDGGGGLPLAPMGIAIDGRDQVFVSDLRNRVHVFTRDGSFLGAWGSPGSGPGEFTDPVTLALDGVSNIYVVEHYGNRVQKFRLLPPLVPENRPDVIVTPPAPGSVAEFLWQSNGGEELPFLEPTGAALDPRGNLSVTDGRNDRIVVLAPGGQVLSPEGVVLETWGTRGEGEGEFNFSCSGLALAGIAFDAAGNAYVTDSGNHRVQKFGPDRRFIASWGSEGDGNGQFTCPLSIVVDGQERVYVGDHVGGKIEVFDPDGNPLATWTEGLARPEQLTLDGDGNLWVADSTNGIFAFSPEGTILRQWDARDANGSAYPPMAIAVDAEGRVFVGDQGARVQVFSTDGTFLGAWGGHGTAPGQFTEPAGLVLDGAGHIYVVDLYGFRVQKFRLLPPFGPG
jgi:tripartite motif-containing protein 71